MRSYELILTYDPDLDEQGVTAQLEKLRAMISSFDGEVIKEENSGRQPLSYPMKKKSYGTYVLLIVKVKPEFVAEFTRQMRINDGVLRFMAVVRDESSGDTIKRAEERPTRGAGGGRYSRDSRGGRDRDRSDSSDDDDSSSDDDDSDERERASA